MPPNDVLCLSLLRWDTVFQRPQQLLGRCARDRRVFFFEEPTFDTDVPHLSIEDTPEGVQVVTPRLPEGSPQATAERLQRELIDQLVDGEEISSPVLWFYSPLALAFTHHLQAAAVVYDCMDDLAATQGPAVLHDREALLLRHADVVFAARPELHQARNAIHPETHLFVSPDPEASAEWDRVWAEMWGLVEDHLDAPDRIQPLPRARQIGTVGARATSGRRSAGDGGRSARRH